MTAEEDAVESLRARKDAAFLERNKVVVALAKVFPSGRNETPGWGEWRHCVYIDLPTGQISWHFHEDDVALLEGISPYTKEWDGHDTEEKYRSLAALEAGSQVSSLRACNNCEWQGQTDRVCGGVGPLCPDCGETTEILSAVVKPAGWFKWTGDYEKQCYDVWVKGCDVVLGCWPNAGFMCTTDGSGRQWKPSEVIAVRVSDFQGRYPTFKE